VGLAGRVAVVTGAGRGIGRSHALFLAREGAKVVVNDVGSDPTGAGTDPGPADEVVAEIRAHGGEAVVSGHDIGDWASAGQLIAHAVSAFGDLHILVNNAGILRDRTLANMSEDEWDAVVRVHLKGHGATTHHAFAYWRDRHQAGDAQDRVAIHTSSLAGLAGNFGQGNYAAAKMGIVGLSRVAAMEGTKYGIRSNVISPAAATRLAGGRAMDEQQRAAIQKKFDPAHVSAVVAWLARADCPATSQVFHVGGGSLVVFEIPKAARSFTSPDGWTPDQIDGLLRDQLVTPTPAETFIRGGA
jgi:NAD(P)-dependent dehydrogenase (short-subunit alcohol dehydrogenase family)